MLLWAVYDPTHVEVPLLVDGRVHAGNDIFGARDGRAEFGPLSAGFYLVEHVPEVNLEPDEVAGGGEDLPLDLVDGDGIVERHDS